MEYGSIESMCEETEMDGFWELTDTLRHVRDFAYARLVGTRAVLGVGMARVVAKIPPTVQLPPWVGGTPR